MNEGMTINKAVLTEIAEMKRAYSALEATWPEKKPVTIAVTSAEPGEGKTTMLAGLAALAGKESGKKVLAMDLNWHAPSLHNHFDARLLDVETAGNGASIQKIVSHVPEFHLDVLAALKESAFDDSENGEEQELAEKLLAKAKDAYDIIFIDTSKVFPLNRHMIDPVAIAHKADGVALVVASGKTSRQQVKRAQFALESAGAHLLGIIINNRHNPLS